MKTGIFLVLFLVTQNLWAKTFNVWVQYKEGVQKFQVEAPSDTMALDSVFVGAIYNKYFKKVRSAYIEESGLSTEDLPLRSFKITTDRKIYTLHIKVVNPFYAMMAIQASKFLMSQTTAREVHSEFDNMKLKDMSPSKFIVKYKNSQASYLMNTSDVGLARVALDIAAQISYKRLDYLDTQLANRSCSNIFAY